MLFLHPASSTTRTHAPSRGSTFTFKEPRVCFCTGFGVSLMLHLQMRKGTSVGQTCCIHHAHPSLCSRSPKNLCKIRKVFLQLLGIARLGCVVFGGSCWMGCMLPEGLGVLHFCRIQGLILFWKEAFQCIFTSSPFLLIPGMSLIPADPSALSQPSPTSIANAVGLSQAS